MKKYARQNHRKGVAKTFVAIPEMGNREVAGYYSVNMSEIKRESLPEIYARGLPRYPVPAMRIGKLAVDQSIQGRKLGEALLMECFRRAVRLSSEVGIFAIAVDAINERAKDFYLNSLEREPLSLFIPMTTIVKACE